MPEARALTRRPTARPRIARPRTACGHDRGVAIISALWATALIAVISVSVLQLTLSDARVVRGSDKAAQLQAAADGAINVGILSLLGSAATQPPVTGTPFTIDLAGTEIRMSVIDESGKIDLNFATPETLQNLLAGAGLSTGEAQDMTARIVDWRSGAADGTSQAGDPASYAGAGLDYLPRHAPFQSVAELRLLVGMSDSLYAAVAPLLTVYSQIAWIDPAFADKRVLQAFAVSDATARAALQQREEVEQGIAPPPKSPGVAVGHAFTITAEAVDRQAKARATRTAVVRLTGDPRSPVVIYRWE